MSEQQEVEQTEEVTLVDRIFGVGIYLIIFAAIFYAIQWFVNREVDNDMDNAAVAEAEFLDKNSADIYERCSAYRAVVNQASRTQNQELYTEYQSKITENYC